MKTLYRYRLTRLGFHFLFVALFGIVGGSLRGFNLLLLLAGLLISIVIVQWRQGRSMIRRTRVRRDPPRGVSAGETVSIAYNVRNLSGWLPLWAIQINDRIVPVNSISVPGEPNGFDDPIHLHASVGAAGPSQTARITVDCRFTQRGHFELGPMVASTAFPFCLMSCERLTSGDPGELFIYPRKISLARGWTALLPPRRGGDGNRSTGGTNHDGEFFGLRPWQSGDHVKHVHWRTTARIGEPAVRQFEQRNRHHVCVVVDGVPEGMTTVLRRRLS